MEIIKSTLEKINPSVIEYVHHTNSVDPIWQGINYGKDGEGNEYFYVTPSNISTLSSGESIKMENSEFSILFRNEYFFVAMEIRNEGDWVIVRTINLLKLDY